MSEKTRLEEIRERDAQGASSRPSYIALRRAEDDRRWLLERVDEMERVLVRARAAVDPLRSWRTLEKINEALTALHAKETDRG